MNRKMEAETEPVQDEIVDETSDEEPALNGKQRLWIIVSGVASFIFFFLLFFPFGGILRSLIQSRLPPQTKLEFSSLQPGFIGQTKVTDLSLYNGNSYRLEAETLIADLSKFALLRFSPNGTIRASGGSFGLGVFNGRFKTLDINLDMSNMVSAPASQWEGTIQIRLDDIEPEELPPILAALPASAEDLQVQRVSLPLKFRKGMLDFSQSQIQSTLFTVGIDGTGRVGANLGDTVLDGRVCLKPVDDLEERNEALHGVYVMAGGASGGELCMKVSGSLSNPSFSRIEQPPAQ